MVLCDPFVSKNMGIYIQPPKHGWDREFFKWHEDLRGRYMYQQLRVKMNQLDFPFHVERSTRH
jgi:hypothetical protein